MPKAAKTNKVKKNKTKKMSKSKSKSKSKTQTTAPVQVVAPTPVAAPTPVQVATPVPVATPEPVSTAPPVPTIDDNFRSLIARFQKNRSELTSIMADFRKLQKRSARELREATKQSRRRKRTGAKTKRAPSGFAKPTKISEELCDFLEKPHGTEMARTEVTKYLTTYIKTHALQDENNKRRILCDEKLSNLLSVGPGTEHGDVEVTYFNLQKFMKPHFPKSAAALAAAKLLAASSN